MADIENNEHNDKDVNAEDEQDIKKTSSNHSDIIELSDIAIGITPEDDAIVELTEDLIDEAFVGFTGATSEIVEEDERVLDLSGSKSELAETDTGEGTEKDEADSVTDGAADHLEDDITKELDDYFGTDEDVAGAEEPKVAEAPTPTVASDLQPAAEKEAPDVALDDIKITKSQLDDAIERVIRKMFAEKINRILDEVIERTVSEEISQLKDYLLGISGSK